MNENDVNTLETASRFIDEIDDRDSERYHVERKLEIERQHGFKIGLICALVVVSVLAFFSFIIYQISTEHEHEKQHQVKVYCYADPNRNDSTSSFTGSADDVKDLCPDQH